jgi:hypothetical protein
VLDQYRLSRASELDAGDNRHLLQPEFGGKRPHPVAISQIEITIKSLKTHFQP